MVVDKELKRVGSVVLRRLTTNTALRFQVCFVRPHPQFRGQEQSYGCKPFSNHADATKEFDRRVELGR